MQSWLLESTGAPYQSIKVTVAEFAEFAEVAKFAKFAEFVEFVEFAEFEELVVPTGAHGGPKSFH